MKKYLLLFFSSYWIITANATQPSGENESGLLCGPIPAVCYPTTTTGGMGIHFVSLNQISNPSGIPAMLEDFTCTDSTWLTPGSNYTFTVNTGQTYEESVTAWIDFNNDGEFIPSEIVFRDSAIVYYHVGLISVAAIIVNTNIPLRMRVGSDYAGNTPLNGCNNAIYGQYEDYTIYFGSGTGINENENRSPVVVSPNPFNSSAILKIDSEFKNAVLKIYNRVGTLVMKSLINERYTMIKREGLPAGFYFYEIVGESHAQIGNGRFIIN